MKQAQNTALARADSPPPIEYRGTTAQPTSGVAVFDHPSRASNDDRTPLNPKVSSLHESTNPSRGQTSNTTGPAVTDMSGSTAVPAAALGGGALTAATLATAAHTSGPANTSSSGVDIPERSEPSRGDRSDRNRRPDARPSRDGTPRSSARGTPAFAPGQYPPQRGGMPPRAGFRGAYGPQPVPGRGDFGPGYGSRGGYQGAPPNWSGRGRGQGPPGYGPGSYGRGGMPPSPREYDNRGMPQYMPTATMPQAYDPSGAPVEPGPWNSRAAYSGQQQQHHGQHDEAAAVIDAYGAASPDMPNVSNFARQPVGNSVERDPASFGFSGRRSPARGSGLPRSGSPAPPLPEHNNITPDAVELDSAPRVVAPEGVVSELDSREAVPATNVHELQG